MVHDIVLKHHERLDGSGYPNGLKEREIPDIAQMAAIVDIYDAVTSNRCYKNPMDSFKALRYLSLHYQDKLNQKLIQQFIKNIGIYPFGSLVKLNSGIVGIVIGQSKKLLFPTLKMIFDSKHNCYIPPTVINTLELAATNDHSLPLKFVSQKRFNFHLKQLLV